MKCPRCGSPLRVISTIACGAAVWDYRHLRLEGYIAALEKYGNNWISRRRKCTAKKCGWTGSSIEVLEAEGEPT